MNRNLSMTEKYTLLMLYGGGSRTDFMACQFSAGIVLGGLLEMIQSRDISVAVCALCSIAILQILF